ncbi:MAG: hypothetical protein MUC88_24175 [Planctomycetes bacterium]|nr:hypothetical protein [Planctomycetota bacterium]
MIARTPMFFHVEERRLWLRTGTHTTLRDRDPQYAQFAEDQRGQIQRLLRIWLAESRHARPLLRAYLGTVSCWAGVPVYREFRRLFRLTSRAAAGTGQSARDLRRLLIQTLREHLEAPAGMRRQDASSRGLHG